MRSLFFLLVLGNLALYGYGQGWLGTPPELQQRSPGYASQEIRADAITVRKEPNTRRSGS
ncbi:hypothetical protein FMZ60_13820 [Alcaligenaceae bacterium SJ-26]|nr:hypothetical protein FMZ60_13820 [Alcaligenaceae bacterium SJ-26]